MLAILLRWKGEFHGPASYFYEIFNKISGGKHVVQQVDCFCDFIYLCGNCDFDYLSFDAICFSWIRSRVVGFAAVFISLWIETAEYINRSIGLDNPLPDQLS